jgi:hypothetical protein
MKAIVAIFVRTRDVELLPAGQPSAAPISEGSHGTAVFGAHKTNRADKSTPNHDESVPAFWTWFIENPRPHSSKSSRSLANLTFAA